MTKAQQILDLDNGKRTTRAIADIIGCLPAYVRVVLRQRMGTGESDIDRRYRRSLRRYANVSLAREACRLAYKQMRFKGGTPRQAASAGTSAYVKIIRRTGILGRMAAHG